MKIVSNTTFIVSRTVRKPVFQAVLFLALLFYVPKPTLAASSGIMGGSFFPSSEKDNDNSPPKITSSGNYYHNNCHDRRSFCYPATNPTVITNNYYTSTQSQSHSQDQRESPKPKNSNDASVGSQRSHGLDIGFFVFTGIIIAAMLYFVLDLGFSKSDRCIAEASVLILQVGLLGSVRSLQKDLNRIAQTADTSKKEGLTYILRETSLAILRHSAFCISSSSSVEIKKNIEDCEKRFYQLSFEERVKFDEHTLANLNNIKWQIRSEPKRTRFHDEYIVITILVATSGVNKLPAVRSSTDLKEALRKIGSICTKETLAVEVMWTPQNEQDTLTEREYVKDYPLLRRLV